MRKKKIYVVGYDDDIECVYGKDKRDSEDRVNLSQFCDPMTVYDAKRKLKEMIDTGAVIYKLVPVSPGGLE